MAYRDEPETIDEIVADLAEQLRRLQGRIAGAIVVTDHDDLTGLADNDHPQYQHRSEQGVAGGYPSLDSGATVPKSQLPADVVYTADLPNTEAAELLAWLAMTEA